METRQPKQLEQSTVRVAIYARYSSDMQSADSADDQIKRIRYRVELGQVKSRKYPDRRLQIGEPWVLKDEAQTGRIAGRDGYEKLLKGIREKSFDVLIVDDLSRLTRSLGNLLSLYDLLKWYEVELISICDAISSEDPSAKTFFTVKGMVNDFSNDIHAERVIRGMEIRALQGFSCGDHPFGYDSAPTKFENAKGRPFPSHYKISINEKEAQVVRRIFSLYELGLGFTRIARTLNKDKIPSPGAAYAKGDRMPVWASRGVRHILLNEKYVGVWKWKKTKVGFHPDTKARTSKDRPLTEWVAHMEGKEIREDLRIVSQDLWSKVQVKFSENMKFPRHIRHHSRWASKAENLPEHPFSGMLECDVCSSNFALVGGKKGGYYGCVDAHLKGICPNNQVIRIDKIETTILAILGEKLSQPEIAQMAARLYNEVVRAKLVSAPKRMKEVSSDLESVDGEIKNLVDFVVQGKGSESITYAIRERETKRTRLLSEMNSLRQFQPKVREQSLEEIRSRLSLLSSAVQKSPMDCYPVIRRMFTRKARLVPMGKTVRGESRYFIKGRMLLNSGLATNFERLVENKKGAASFSQPPFSSQLPNRESEDLEFSGVVNGVPDFSRSQC